MKTLTPDTGGTVAHVIFGLRKAAPDGEVARVLLAFLATAGIFYVNIMPALVDGLVQGAGFSNRHAGMIVAQQRLRRGIWCIDRRLHRQEEFSGVPGRTRCSPH